MNLVTEKVQDLQQQYQQTQNSHYHLSRHWMKVMEPKDNDYYRGEPLLESSNQVKSQKESSHEPLGRGYMGDNMTTASNDQGKGREGVGGG